MTMETSRDCENGYKYRPLVAETGSMDIRTQADTLR